MAALSETNQEDNVSNEDSIIVTSKSSPEKNDSGE